MKVNELNKMIQEELNNMLKEFLPDDVYGNIGDDSDDNRSVRYLFTVKRDKEGIERIKQAKESMSDIFTFQLRGQHNDRKEILGSKWEPNERNDVPIKDAEYISVYVSPK